ncbi:hypothetical protein [Sinomicrobium weinanense]|uniref:Uncharacterized protein n=1 Tax=Sinomicrobium weinanense TaxID=2842200 RepID=A0A926Q452_9FLAO|nr:hypothetical protein [Sinomicrobium weinanense]MBC9796706.1 hypothetical protein [Sinomicrobium weinanense]MBU3123019.1 hypothetical protein [Sinomicrobium weinanense]
MKTAIQIALWLLSIFFAYKIYRSVNDPIKFDKVKKERYAKVIDKLKEVRDAQEAYRTVTGKFAKDFNSLIRFIDTAEFAITQQRDTSWMEYDKVYRIDMQKEGKIIDTLGFVSVKDSLFKGTDSYKTLMDVPNAPNNEKFKMDAGIIDRNGFKASVFEAKVDKGVILHDQPKDLLAKEKQIISISEVPGPEIIVGSLEEVSTTGNWPIIYDSKKDE